MPCTNCMVKYSLVRKEHGCSNCGYGFCQKCLTRRYLLPRLSPKPVPVCDGCYGSLTGESVQPLEKDRDKSTGGGGKWWGSVKPPPSLRDLYPTKPKNLESKDEDRRRLTEAQEDSHLTERLARVLNRTTDEVKNPRYIISDRDDGDIPSSSSDILSNLRQPPAPTTNALNSSILPNETSTAKPGCVSKDLTKKDENSLASLEERLAALRNVPVDMIRKPRLMVTNEDDPKLDEDAKKLLERAEQRLRKKEPDLFYENEAWSDSDN